MDYQNKNQTITIFHEGRIDSNTAPEVEEEVKMILEGEDFEALVFDFQNVSYLSSAGLRVILKFSQKYQNFSVINVSTDVYEIFEMTGFTSLITIKKKYREINVKGCDVVGKGYTSEVYRLNKDTLVKVFINSSLEDIEREISLAKKAFIAGIPTALSFDIVKVGDQYGVVFEMLDCSSLCDLIIKFPEDLDTFIQKYAKLCKKITSTKVAPNTLPSAKEFALDRLEYIKNVVGEDIYTKLNKMLVELPETNTLVHGDFHIKNIMVQSDDEYMLIDMYTVCQGHPIFELAAMCCSYICYPESEPDNTLHFFGLPLDVCHKIYFDTLDYYFQDKTEQEKKDALNKIYILANMHILYIVNYYNPEQEERIARALQNLKDLLPLYDSLDF